MNQNQSGNALWFILVAVVLLAALTIILTRSGGNVTQNADSERQRVLASQVTKYAQGLTGAIDQMLLRGVSESQISFQNATTATDYTNAACTDSACRVFDSGGGGQVYRAPPPDANDGSEWIFTGANNVGTTALPVGTTAAGTGNDLLLLLPNASAALCIQINRDLEIGTAGVIPTDDTGIASTAFTGTYAASLTILDGDSAPLELNGRNAGCFTDTAANPDVTYFYYVLLAR